MGSGHGSKKETQLKWEDVTVVTGHSPEELNEFGIIIGTRILPLRSECGPHILGAESNPLLAAWTFDKQFFRTVSELIK